MRVAIPRERWIRHSAYQDGGYRCVLGWLQHAGALEPVIDCDALDLVDAVGMKIYSALMHVNDTWPDPDREQKLIDLAGKAGIDLEFIG